MTYIGIDPDITASGFAMWDSRLKTMMGFTTLDLFDITTTIKSYYDKVELMVIIESGWENLSSLHHKTPLPSGYKTWSVEHIVNYVSRYSSSIGNKVGRNHEIGRQIEKFCIKYEIHYKLSRPTTSKWNKTQCKQFTGISTSNQDIRDAIKLVFGR